MDVRLLGSGGWIPSDERETSCVLLRSGSHALTFDAGSGLRRLVSEPALLEGVDELSIVLTHFHLDHTIGLLYSPAFKGLRRREVWAPGRLVAGIPAEEVVHRLLDPPFIAGEPAQVTDEFLTGIHELGAEAEIGPFRIETRVQPLHVGPTLALKLDGRLAYCTDTAYDEENVDFVRGTEALLHEAFLPGDTTDDRTHSTAGEAARIAAAADVGRLVLVHVNPRDADEPALLSAARARFPSTEVGRDGMSV